MLSGTGMDLFCHYPVVFTLLFTVSLMHRGPHGYLSRVHQLYEEKFVSPDRTPVPQQPMYLLNRSEKRAGLVVVGLSFIYSFMLIAHDQTLANGHVLIRLEIIFSRHFPSLPRGVLILKNLVVLGSFLLSLFFFFPHPLSGCWGEVTTLWHQRGSASCCHRGSGNIMAMESGHSRNGTIPAKTTMDRNI